MTHNDSDNDNPIHPYIALADADIALDKARKLMAINPCPETIAAVNNAKDAYEKAYIGYSKANAIDIEKERNKS